MNSAEATGSGNRFGWIVTRLTGSNVLITVLALVTSPILARTLGPTGRGQVAAVFTVVNLAPWISELGMTAFLSRAHARKDVPLGVLLGSTMPIALTSSLVIVALAEPVARVIGHDHKTVVTFIELGLFLLPVGVFAGTLNGVALAEQRWGLLNLARVLLTVGTALTIVVIWLTGEISVRNVAITYITWGILAVMPYLVTLRGSWPWQFNPNVARSGLVFGLRSWLSTVANVGNAQLDQVLMAALVSSRQLGLYSLAVTLSLACNSLIGATAYALFPRVAAGESALAARACRVTLLLILLFDIVMAAASPFAIPLVFGSRFNAMLPMLLVLLAANLFFVPSQVLGNALIAAGHPQATARGQVVGLVVTVPALAVVLPLAGGLGAAWVSFAAYGVTFYIILLAASRTFAMPYTRILFVHASDLRWLMAQIRRRPRSAA